MLPRAIVAFFQMFITTNLRNQIQESLREVMKAAKIVHAVEILWTFLRTRASVCGKEPAIRTVCVSRS